MERYGQFVEDHHVVIAAVQQPGAACEPLAGRRDVRGIGLPVDVAAAAELLDPDLPESCSGAAEELLDPRLVVLHRFDELSDIDLFPGAQRPYGQPERRRCLAFPVARIDVDVSSFHAANIAFLG